MTSLALAAPEPGVAVLQRPPQVKRQRILSPPKTPPGLPPCTTPIAPASDLPRAQGETIRYLIDVDGLSVGTIDFKIEKKGLFEGRAVTEYRSLFKIDGLVATFVPVEGQAASLVPDSSFAPARAMSRYKLSNSQYEENQVFSAGGKGVVSKRVRDGRPAEDKREFPSMATDFVSGFYMLRRLAPEANGCALIYGNHRVYTIWIKPDGTERVKTPVGLREARRYSLAYASDKSKRIIHGHLWVGDTDDRLPYRAELNGDNKVEARIHLFENGK